MSWYRALLWDLRQDITSCQNVAAWNLRFCICGAPTLIRGRVCNLQCRSGSYFTTDSQSVSQYVLVSSTLVGMLLSEICGLVSMGSPFWREDGSAICSVITQWSESLKTHNHILLSHLTLPQPGGPGSHIRIPPETGWPSYTPEHWVPFMSSLTTRRTTVEVF
jgi:hypothetical protein